MEISADQFARVDLYISELFSLEDDALRQCEQSIIDAGMPSHSISPTQGSLLQLSPGGYKFNGETTVQTLEKSTFAREVSQ